MMKKLLTFFLTALLAFSVGWADEAGFAFTTTTVPVAQNNSSGTISGVNETWNVSISGTLSYSAMSGTKTKRYWQMGKSSNSITSATFSTNGISGTITKIVVDCASATSAGGSVSATVGNTSFTPSSSSTLPQWSSNAGGEVEFTGNATGEIVVTIVPQSGKACYLHSITVTYEAGGSTPVTVDAPVFTINGTTVTGSQTVDAGTVVTISAASGNYISYTTDGTDPGTSSTAEMTTGNTATVTIDATTRIRAIAIDDDLNSSDEVDYTFTVNSGGGEPSSSTVYRKVTSTDDLEAGKQYIIVYENGSSSAAMSAFNGTVDSSTGKLFSAVTGLSLNNNRIDIANNSNVLVLTLGGSTDAWTLHTGSGYIRGTDGVNFTVQSSLTAGDKVSRWKISADGVVNNSYLTDRYIRYYSNNPSFRHYTTSYGDNAYLYVQESSDPTLSVSANELSIEVPYNESSANATFTVTGSNLTENSVSVSVSGADFSVLPTSIAVANGSVNQEITVTYNGTSTTPVTGTVTVTCGDLSETVTVTAQKQTPPPPTMTVSANSLTVGANGGSFNVTAANLTQALTVTPSTGFSVNPSTLATDATYPATVNVTYSGQALGATGTVTVGNSNDNLSQTVNVTYTYDGDMYIVGDLNHSGWDFTNGVQMTRNQDGTYSAHVTAQAGGEGYAWLYFTKQVGNEQTVVANAFGPVSNGNWGLTSDLYGVPCDLDVNGNLHTIYMNPGSYEIVVNPANNKFTITPSVAAPVITPATGTYREAQTVEITCATPGAAIYYTTDGTTPTTSSTLYNGSFTVDATTTITAIAVSNGLTSDPVTSTITIKLPGSDEFILVESTDDITAEDEYVLVYTSTAGVNHAMSTHNGSYYIDAEDDGFILDGDVVTVEDDEKVNIFTLIDAGEGTFYIKDMDSKYIQTAGKGNVNRSNDPISKWSITLNDNGAASIYSGSWYLQFNASSPRFACYAGTVQNAKLYKRGSTVKVQAPVITPAGGTSNKFYESVDVEITCATENVTIYYTLDGSTPTASSDEYDPAEGLTVPYGSAPTTVKAIAVDGEGNVSRVTTMVYYWDRVKVAITPESQQVISNVEVTITPTPSDATVTYQVNGGAAQTYTGPFTVTVTEENPEVTVVATATKGESTATATATYTFKDGGVNSIAEFNALSTDEEVFFKNPVTVLFEYSQNTDATQDYIWVKDRTGYAQLFITPAFDNTNFKPKYENGDVIPAGFTVVKNYYSNGGYFQGFCNGENRSTFKDATEKALADPEQVTLTQLLNSIPTESGKYSEYNNRYLYINKLKVSNISGLGFSIATDEDGDGTAEVSGGSDVVGYNKYHDWKNKQGQTVGVTLPTDGQYYNVTFIFQKWQGGYEIMPIEFTRWEENKVRLEDLVKIEVSTPNKEYTISNDLIATKVTWDDNKGKFAIFAKDDEAYASPRHRLDGQESYFIRYENVNHPELNNTVMQEDYDQSNWVEILIPSAINSKLDGGYQSQLDEFKSQFENKILPGGSIRGTYIDKLNPTIEYNLSELPSNLAKSVYKPNIYTPVNFLMENIDDIDGAKSYRDDELGNQYFFMMDGKPQEMGLVVWCYYPGNGDYFYIPARVGDQVNGHQFRGSFKADMSLCEDPDVSTANGGGAIVNCFAPSNADGNGIDQVKLYGFNAIVRKNPAYNSGSSNGAPRRVDVAPYYEGTETNPAYIVYPLNAGAKSTGTVTSVAELASSRVVESVRYYNIMGMESEQPFEGINIVVTRYSDGSSSTAKVLR